MNGIVDKIIEAAGQLPVQIQVVQRRARKPWICKSCGTEILPGTPYWNRVVRIYGQPVNEPFCSEHFCQNCEPEPIMGQIRERQREILTV
jgi:hypothetical protein